MKAISFICCLFLASQIAAQTTSINFELNGRPTNREIQDSISKTVNPFAKFIGEWTLKEDTWIQNWGGKNDTIKIPKHHTVSSQVNTENSLFSIIDGPEPNGHIFWSYNPNSKAVDHLSSFGTIRIGKGSGEFYGDGNLRLKVSFEGEAAGTYRIYTYEWRSKDEYALKSIQYDKDNKPTGLFYQGDFVRLKPEKSVKEEIEAILAVLDNYQLPKEVQVSVYKDDVVHMAPKHEAITSKAALLSYLNEQKEHGHSDMTHQIVEISEHGDVIIMRGKVNGTFHSVNGGEPFPFETKNLFVFERIEGELKIAKVIYNMNK
ncbi:MAG: hypothetical protein MRZ79_27155 [Bacteroidia bacterium]|nr:hypothetical protein [Bacteroidia bacterium]